MTASGLLAWGAVFYALYLIRVGLGTDLGKQLVEAVINRIRGKDKALLAVVSTEPRSRSTKCPSCAPIRASMPP